MVKVPDGDPKTMTTDEGVPIPMRVIVEELVSSMADSFMNKPLTSYCIVVGDE